MATTGQVFDFTVDDSTLVGLLKKINSFTDVGFGGSIGILILLIVGGGLTMMLRAYGNERAFPVSMFVTCIIGVFLRIIGLINDLVFWIVIALGILSIIFLIKEQSQYE